MKVSTVAKEAGPNRERLEKQLRAEIAVFNKCDPATRIEVLKRICELRRKLKETEAK